MQTAQPTERPHRNHGLFSDHYLNTTLPDRPDWRALENEAAGKMAEVARVLGVFTPSANEAQTEEDLVRPVLRLLGHDFEVQPALTTPEGTKRPDYVLYRDATSLAANKDTPLTDELLNGRAFAVGDAKFWERPLDVSLKGAGRNRDVFSNKNPSYQISFYMQHAGTEWGVLTNGRLWRLYHKGTAHKLDRFYEVDLPALVEGGDADAFLYFFAFFRRDAFEDGLSRVGGQFVDYRDLAERHLGTIYEGLLEYHLEALPEDEARENGWTVALLNDRGERRATGSYYTPDFVVKHIVETTVGPLLREAVEGANTDEEKVRAVLAVNLLDPSMGSGHFLVEATEYIARFLVELGAAPEGVDAGADAETELAYWKRRVAQSCVYGVDANPLAVDLAKLSLWLATVARDRPLSFLDHHLRCGNTLVGARISELQFAAAKKRKKKSIDGNEQLSMLEDDAFRRNVSTAVGSIWLIEDSRADTVEDVREQERLYARLREDLTRRYARLADLATATHFGIKVDRSLWRPLADYATKGALTAPPQFDAWLDAAERVARERRFFHWELEFPDIFFDRQGRPLGEDAGFDAVVGNPPYVRQESLGDLKPYLAGAYPETYHGVADLYVYFYQQGLRQLRRGGRMSYIVTNKWLRAGYGEPLRGFFAAEGALEEIVDFGHAPIFPDADVFPCIVVLHKPKLAESDGDREVRVVEFPREALKENTDLAAYVADHANRVPKERFGRAAWSLETSAVDDLMTKIRENGVPLAEYAGVKPLYGIKTGLNEAFLIDTPTKERLVREDSRSAEVIKPYLRGQDIKRWSPEWRGLWIVGLKSSGDHTWPWSDAGGDAEEVFRRTYPSLHAHMKSLEDRLRKRQDKGHHWWELRSCAYYDAFEQPKIIHTDITWRPQFAFVDTPTFLLNTAYMWPTDDLWLLAVVNSPLLWSYMWRNATHGKDEALRITYSFTETLPITQPTEEARREAEGAVGRLISLTRTDQETRRDTLDWLHVEFGLEKPGQKLEDFAALDADAFVEEVRKRRPKGEGRLTPGALRDLRAGYEEQATPVREARAEAARLERRLSDLVNAAYGLTSGEVDLLWKTAPPRMPRF